MLFLSISVTHSTHGETPPCSFQVYYSNPPTRTQGSFFIDEEIKLKINDTIFTYTGQLLSNSTCEIYLFWDEKVNQWGFYQAREGVALLPFEEIRAMVDIASMSSTIEHSNEKMHILIEKLMRVPK